MDDVNRAEPNQILISQSVHEKIKDAFASESLGAVSLKGKGAPTPLFALIEKRE